MNYILIIILLIIISLVNILSKYNRWNIIMKEYFKNQTTYDIYNGIYDNYLPKHIINKITSQYQLDTNKYNKSVSKYYLI
jgi:hypothetical protein